MLSTAVYEWNFAAQNGCDPAPAEATGGRPQERLNARALFSEEFPDRAAPAAKRLRPRRGMAATSGAADRRAGPAPMRPRSSVLLDSAQTIFRFTNP